MSPAPELPPVPFAYRCAAALVKPFMAVAVRRDWRGQDNVPAQGGAIVAANHVSGVDPLCVAHYLYDCHRPPKIMAKASLWKVPVLGWMLRKTGQIPVFRKSARAAGALDEAQAALGRGECILIYPEGTITKDPRGWPMQGRSGVARLALRAGVPVVPVVSWGAQDLLAHGQHVPRFWRRPRVHVLAGPPVDLSDLADSPNDHEAARLGTERVLDALAALVGELRGETPPAERWNPDRPGGGLT